jgi:hypothetical protein
MRKKFMVQKSLFKAINQPKRLTQGPAIRSHLAYGATTKVIDAVISMTLV